MVADWSTGDRIGVVLNRNGEILIFKRKRLVFARRRGVWHHFTHDPIIRQMGRVGSEDLRQAVYEACLDVSFARTGGCIALAKSNRRGSLNDLVNPDDFLADGQSTKSRALKALVDKPFHELDRRFRQELAAIDGAMVLDHKGTVLSVGAIVRVPGGSESGARRAAAKALSRLGVGIKISADGGIAGFVYDDASGDAKLAFEFG
jgi:hypothetical protein